MDTQFTRGRLSAVAVMLDDLRATLGIDMDRVATSAHDDHYDDPAWETVAKTLSDAYMDIIRARDRVEEANDTLWRLMGRGATHG